MFSRNKETAEVWLDIHYPNVKSIDNRGMIFRDFPDYVINFIKRKWYKEQNKRGYVWYDKEYTDNSPQVSNFWF
tara:strand:- start:125 stop:346 length:222 start_codon:yes stop_codon:yes gene_type:complete